MGVAPDADARTLDRLRGGLNPRQTKALLRLFREEPDGFQGGLSAANYRRITGAPASTATRDLADLVAKRALRRTGERRHTRYWLDLPSSAPDVDDVADEPPPMR